MFVIVKIVKSRRLMDVVRRVRVTCDPHPATAAQAAGRAGDGGRILCGAPLVGRGQAVRRPMGGLFKLGLLNYATLKMTKHASIK